MVDYACRLPDGIVAGDIPLSRISAYQKSSYSYDLFHQIYCLPQQLRINYLFEDVTHIPEKPTFVKSRPISTSRNSNSILLPLNCRRHFYNIRDPFTLPQKTPRLIWRGAAHQRHRVEFLKKAFALPCCDVANTAKVPGLEDLTRPYMSIREQLRYRFILALEGNDVASNLFWVLCSNSVAFMPKPKYEIWAYPGRLRAGIHYVEIDPSCEDLAETIQYYAENPKACSRIVEAAHAYCMPFKDLERQYRIGREVILEFARLSGQI